MAFEGDLSSSTMANTLFPMYQRQTSLNVGVGINGSVPFMSIPSEPLQELNTGPYIPWSHNTHDDPFELLNNAKNRKPSDVADDGETELQGLVSNILDEAESQDSFYCDGNQNSNIWSPKILRDELLQYFQSEPKTQYGSTFTPNNSSHGAFGKAQGQAMLKETEELCQVTSNGFNSNQHPLFNFSRAKDIFSPQHGPSKPPPGLPLPLNMASTYMSPVQQNNYDNRVQVSKERGNSEPMSSFPDFRHGFQSQCEINGEYLFYEDYYNQGMDKPAAVEQYNSQDLNQLVSSFQSFVAGEEDSNEFPNMQVQQEDNSNNNWGSPGSFIRGNNSRQMGVDFAREQNGATRKQLFKRDSLQDLPSFNLQAAEFSPRAKLPFGHQNQTRENSSFLLNMNQFQKQLVQHSPLKYKPQMQKEKKRMPGFYGDNFNTPGLSSDMLSEEKRPNHFYEVNARPPRFERESNMLAAGSSQQFMPFMYAEQRRPPNRPQNPNFSPRASLAYRGGVEVGDVGSSSEMSGGFSQGFNNMMMRRGGESTFHGMSPGLTSPAPMNQSQPVVQLFFYLDECYEQWKCLERERKRTEIVLSKTFLGKRTSALPNSSLPKTPPNPSKVDHLIVNQMREQARVSSLLDKMECLSGVPINANIYVALSKHNTTISVTSARRREEITNMSQRQRAAFNEDKVSETMMLVLALKDLAASTRKLRTALWCALQMTLPKPTPRAETPLREDKPDEACPSVSAGYSYRI